MSKDVAEEYTSSLADLTVNSKSLINKLTMLAEDYVEHAPIIVKAVEAHLQKVSEEFKLSVLYLIDSIVKNVGKEYISLFTQNIVSNFCSVFEKVKKIRAQMFKLRQTWNDVFPSKNLYALDARVNAIDPAWPITAAPPDGRIQVNPNFLSPASSPGSLSQSTSESVSIITDGTMQEELLTKKKELLELQKRKVELELLQTKAILEEHQRKIDSQLAALKSGEASHSSINKKMAFKPESKKPEIKESMKPNTSFVAEMVTETNPQHQNFFIKGNILRRDPRWRLRPVNDQRSTVSNSANSQPSVENSAPKAKKADPVPMFVDENKDDNSKSKIGGSHAPSSSSSLKRKSEWLSEKHNRDLKPHHVRMFYQKIPGGDKGGEQLLPGDHHDTDDHSSTGKSSSPRKSDRVSDQSLEDGQGSADIPISDNDGTSNKRPFFGKNHDQQLSREEMRNRYHWASKPWMSRPTPVQQHHSKMPLPRDSFFNQRWVGKAPLGRSFDPKEPGFQSRYGPPMRVRNLRHPQDLPPAYPAVLEMIKNDPMALVNVGGAVREIRFYGESAVIMMAWDDPRDLTFQSGCRRVIFDDVDVLSLQFNAPYRDYTLNDGIRIKIRLGAPTRELFIDGRFYDIKFGGAPIEASLKGRIHRVQLEGPIPFLVIGHVKRTDLVVGRVNLIVDANVKDMFPIYLDAKPQRFDVGGVPFILKFVEALQTVFINGRPFKVDFGGMPFPIYFHGDKHFLRMTHLPEGVVPGYVNVLNMEGGRISFPPPNLLPPTPLPPPPAPFTSQGLSIDSAAALPQPPYFTGPEKRFELLSSLLPSQQISPFPVQAYNIEQYQEPPATVETTTTTAISASSAVSNTASTMNLSELIQRLVESGIVPAVKDKEDQTQDDKFCVKVVDFGKSETLKVKQPGLINKLYSGHQCGNCGVRFPPEFRVKYSPHLDWHFRQNRKERDFSKIAISRRWNFDISDWIQYQEIEDIEDRVPSWFEIQEKKNSKEKEEEQMEESTVPAKGLGEHPCCSVCQDRFDQFFNEEEEEWQLKRAVCIEDKLYHPLCYRDFKENPGHLIPMLPFPPQEEIAEIVETIVLDDSTPGVSSEDEKMKGLECGEVDSTSATTEDVTSLDNVTTEETSSKLSGEEGDNTDKDDEANTSMDDDLVVVGVVQPVVEKCEILDDDDEETIELEETKEDEEELREGDEVMEMDEAPPPVRIKTENLDLSPPHIGPPASHPIETVSLDGNPEFKALTTVVLPKKIKITISSLLPKPTLAASTEEPQTTNSDSSDMSSKVQTDFMEPLLLAEELRPVQIKPKIVKSNLIDMPPISQGKEMSGLCSIM